MPYLANLAQLTGNAEADEQIRELVPSDAPEPWISAINAMYEANDAAFTLPANPADADTIPARGPSLPA